MYLLKFNHFGQITTLPSDRTFKFSSKCKWNLCWKLFILFNLPNFFHYKLSLDIWPAFQKKNYSHCVNFSRWAFLCPWASCVIFYVKIIYFNDYHFTNLISICDSTFLTEHIFEDTWSAWTWKTSTTDSGSVQRACQVRHI